MKKLNNTDRQINHHIKNYKINVDAIYDSKLETFMIENFSFIQKYNLYGNHHNSK
jgi:hypothetical protein